MSFVALQTVRNVAKAHIMIQHLDVLEPCHAVMSDAHCRTDPNVDKTGYAAYALVSGRRWPTGTSNLVAAEVAAATRENLNILGNDASRLITSRLPSGHKLRKAIHSSIVPAIALVLRASVATQRP